jgi:hypothetical protein
LNKFLIQFIFSFIAAGTSFGQYCSNTGPTSTIDSNVEVVKINGENDSINFIGCPGVIGLQDLTSLNSTLSAGNSYLLDVKFGTCGGNYAGVGQIWIDFDKNGVFDSSESIGTWVGTPPVTISSYTINVPSDAQNGLTRMRIMQREAGTLPIDPCQTYNWGSAMDFGITIINGMDCLGYIGDEISDAIVIENLPYSDIRDNSICYSNENNVYPSPDIYYKLDPNPLMQTITASLCGSSFDTFLSVMDAFGNIISFNDDANCGAQSEVSFDATNLGTLYFIVEGWGNEVGSYQLNIESTTVGHIENIKESIFFYPNPSAGIFTINKSLGKLTLYDIDGEMITTFDSNENKIIDLNSFSIGVYIIKSQDGSLNQRLIKIK